MLRDCMITTRRKKIHTRTGEKETRTEDICDDKQREEMLKGDESLLPKTRSCKEER